MAAAAAAHRAINNRFVGPHERTLVVTITHGVPYLRVDRLIYFFERNYGETIEALYFVYGSSHGHLLSAQVVFQSEGAVPTILDEEETAEFMIDELVVTARRKGPSPPSTTAAP